MELIKQLWASWAFHNALVACIVAGAVYMILQMRGKAYWRLAAREVMKRWLPMISFYIICIYLVVAFLDSIGWHHAVGIDADGQVIRSEAGQSVLDWLLTDLREEREQTYSAPMASVKFDPEPIYNPETGETKAGHKPLQYPGAHLLGTDKVGRNVLYIALKGVRTGIVIGGLTTMLAIPFAIFFGVIAGYFGGFVDDIVQYIYTTLASIPGVLLIMAFILIFGEGLVQLCIIMGVTAWVGLCRVLRGETLKLREMEYIQSARSMGVPSSLILLKHIVPNLLHLVLISTVMAFAGNVMVEAALAFIGIGVGSEVYSWGGMINDARLELARDPVIWWKLAAAFAFMLGLVLPANIFGDAVRDALDPRLRTE